MKSPAKLLLIGSIVAVAPIEAAPRDGKVEQAMSDTAQAHMAALGITADDIRAVETRQKMYAELQALKASSGGTATWGTTWRNILAKLSAYIPWPLKVGFGGGGGSFGGAGADGFWKGIDCDDVTYFLDVSGNLMVPADPLTVGLPMVVSGMTVYNSNLTQEPQATPDFAVYPSYYADNAKAQTRYALHKLNSPMNSKAWRGVYKIIGQTHYYSSPAYRDNSGNLIAATFSSIFVRTDTYNHGPATFWPGNQGTNNPCPMSSTGGADTHYYGHGTGANIFTCIAYIPNYAISKSGYAYPDHVPIASADAKQWPQGLHQKLKDCPVDPELIRKVTDAIFKKVSEQPNYTGVPYSPIAPDKARPNDTKVDDLGDEPGTQPSTPSPGPGVNDPPPTTTTPPSTPGFGDECDFGPTGCTDPGTPAPDVGEPPDNILSPVFDWLPDLPSITINTAGAQCPTWPLDLTAFGGSGWSFVMEDHCPFIESQRAAISVLMVVLFGIGAAMIILRA